MLFQEIYDRLHQVDQKDPIVNQLVIFLKMYIFVCNSQTLPKAVNLQECTTDTILHNEIVVERVQSLTAYVYTYIHTFNDIHD